MINNPYDTNSDPATKRGLIILSVCLLALIGFFFWYTNRPVRYQAAATTTSENGGLLGRLFSSESHVEAAKPDQDNDGLADEAEQAAGTDPVKVDSDSDGLSDVEEVNVYKTNPRAADSDNDGTADGVEIRERHDPLNPDPAAIWPPRPASL